jgi:hypothetical protein
MKKQNLTLSLALATIFSSSVAFAEVEVSGKFVYETAKYTNSGQNIGAAETKSDIVDSHRKDVFKTEATARIYIDGNVTDDIPYHVELQAFNNGDAINAYNSNKSYTQRDLLREAYIDAETNGIMIRAGKQQVVWGTADGMKLLDAINPTDYTEMAQNQMEDSRIPVWMLNAEKDLETGANIQVVISEAKGSVFAGLGKAAAAGTTNKSATNSDRGHPFVMKGVDSITGRVNGFLNIAPGLGKVAKFAFGGDHITGNTGGILENNYGGAGLTVWDYTNDNANMHFGGGTSWVGLCGAAAGQDSVTNLCDAAGGDENNPDSAFEFMTATSFATFDTLGQVSSEYRVKHTDGDKANASLRYKNSTTNGVNYSFNYMNGYDTNPSVDMHWEKANGSKLFVGTTTASDVSSNKVTNIAQDAVGSSDDVTTVRLYPTAADATADTNRFNSIDEGGPATLVFVESLSKIQNIGGSFDMAVETPTFGPVVIRGEALYQKDVESPVIDRKKLGYGDLVGGLTMVKGDMFKYVLGADITVLTNMMISAQFIQEMNLDYINEAQTVNLEHGANHGRYTADRAAMHMSNGLQKAEENKEFYSLFLSKPYGASGEHRWNNIIMFEENGGRWNRLDTEISIDDDTQATLEWNKYFGEKNTQFGQLKNSSNIQVGIKYSF